MLTCDILEAVAPYAARNNITHLFVVSSRQRSYDRRRCDGPSKRPQKIGCYVQKCAVICAVTEDVNLSWEGWEHYRKIERNACWA